MNNGADCTIKNGALNGDEGPIMVQGGTTNLIGCKISTKYTPVYVSRGTANITDCTLTNEDANKSVVINNTGTVNISGTTNISSTIYKNQTANICLTFLQAHIILTRPTLLTARSLL